MGLFDGLLGKKKNNGAKLFNQEMAAATQALLERYLAQRNISFEQLEDLDRQVLMVYLFGLVAAVNVEEQRGYGPQEMGEVEISMIQTTFHQNKRMAMICAHDIVEQTKTRDQANPIYGIVLRGEQIFPTWRNGLTDRVIQDMESVVGMMHDLQNNVAVNVQNQQKELPTFKYHPNFYKGDSVVYGKGTCQCCGQEVDTYVDTLYGDADIHCICMDCVKSGKAVEKFGGEFSKNVDELLPDTEATDELLHRTPGYRSWQGENWLTCCDDYCAYLGKVGTEELQGLGIADAVFAEYRQREDCVADNIEDMLTVEGPVTGYLFQCTHCGAYHLWADVQD